MSAPLDTLTDTWTSGATTYNGIGLDVTDTASAAASKLLNLKVGGTSKFTVQKDGATVAAAGLTLTGGVTLTGAQTVTTTTGDLTIATGGGNGNILLSNNGTGLVGINVATPVSALHVGTSLTSSPRGVMSAQYSTGTDGARFHMRKARGTEASPTTVVTGDTLGRLVFTGYDGTSYQEMGSLEVDATGTIAATRVPTLFKIRTATDATPSVLTEALRVTAAQNTLIGGTSETGLTGSGGLRVFSTTEATSSAGAAIVDGGVLVKKALFVTQTTSSTTSTTGSLVVGNGTAATSVGIGAGNLVIGGTATINTKVIISMDSGSVDAVKISDTNATNPRDWLFGPGTGVVKAFTFRDSTGAANYFGIYSGAASSPGTVFCNGTTEATTGGAGALTVAGGIYATKAIISGSATASTSTTTGGGIFAGGVGVAGAINVGGDSKFTSTTAATTTAGAVLIGTGTAATSVTIGGGKMVIGDTTAASATGGALTVGTGVSGGTVGIGNGQLYVSATTASTTTTGALVVGNGTASTTVTFGGGNGNMGGNLTLGGNITAIQGTFDNSSSIGFTSRGKLKASANGKLAIWDSAATTYGAITTGSHSISTTGAATAYVADGSATVTSATKLIKTVASIADNTATDVLTVTIPNAAHSGSVEIRLVGSLGAGGAIGANEASGVISYSFSIARTAGVATVTTASSAYGSATSSVAGAATITITAAASGMTGATSATQTFTIQVTIARGSGSSTNHTCLVLAEVMNANATGISIA